jgi:hypothetical protein
MLYAILCYGNEAKISAMTPEQDEALMKRLAPVDGALIAEGKLGPHFRLRGTDSAKHLRAGEHLVLDGPFAETKEQLLGLYLLDCATFEDAVDAARRLEGPRVAAGVGGTLEIRPLRQLFQGKSLA